MQYRGLQLDPFQEQAIGHLEAGDSVLVCAPTGTGKTIIADWIVEQALATGKRVIYTAPVKALSNQKYRDWTRLHGEANVGLVTGDLVIRRDAPCLVMTTEILRNVLLTEGCPEELLAVVIDEIHFLDDRERGTVWEEVLIYLPPEVQIVGLSATLSNLEDFGRWLESVRHRPVRVVVEEERAVPLEILYASVDTGLCTPAQYRERQRRHQGRVASERGDRRGRRGPRTRHVHLHDMMRKAGLLPYLHFVFSRRDTERYARQLAERLDAPLLDPEAQSRLALRLDRARAELGPVLDKDLRWLLERGVAFHHAGLHVHLKGLVEELYEARLLQVLYCTSTFALGINVPARAVCFDRIEKYDGDRVAPLTVRQFMQKAGRAGRRGMDEVGSVVVRVEVEDWHWMRPILERYARAEPEPVHSSFNLSWNSVVNLLSRHDDDAIRRLVERSFLSWHLGRRARAEGRRRDLLDQGEALGARERKELRRLERRHARDQDRVWNEFQAKVSFLTAIGYLAEDRSFNAGAKLLQNVQIAEILVTELLLAGVFEGLDAPTTFGLLCAVTGELARHAEWIPPLTLEDRRLLQAVREVFEGPVVRDAQRLAGGELSFGPTMLPIGRMWAQGRPLAEILRGVAHDTDLSGDLVTAIRRAKDLASQLAVAHRDLPPQRDLFAGLVRSVSRDEVEVVG